MANADKRDIPAWLALSRAELPPRQAIALLEHFKGPVGIFSASPIEIAEAVELTPASITRLLAQRPDDVGVKDQARLLELGVSVITLADFAYPPLLRQISDPPILLHVKGELTEQDNRAIDIVGSRRCSPYGRLVAHSLARELAARGITVVSGLAMGIDGAAHQGALETGGRTIGVVGCGIDIDYPKEHAELKEKLVGQGAIVSEVPVGTRPTPGRFPVRNRIISGLSLGTIVVEAPERSGALITARLAAEQGREVFAVPGSVNSYHSRGCHKLIKDGAKLAESVDDILEELKIAIGELPKPQTKSCKSTPAADEPPAAPFLPAGLTPEENKLLACLSLHQKYIDDIIGETALPSAQVIAGLMMLELKGLIKRLPGNLFVRVK